MNRSVLSSLFLAFTSAVSWGARPFPELAKSPPMGWNSWNFHGKKDISEKVVQETIDAMVTSGLRDAGYVYVVVDGGWRDTKLGPNGELLAHPTKFPAGMKRLADYAHARGLKFGLHTAPGTHDCGGDAVGGFGREEVHLKQFVDWGLDLVKIDKCKYEPGWTEDKVKSSYAKWAELMTRSGREMIFSISAYEYRDWYPEVCHMARTTYDIRCRIHKGGGGFDDPEIRPNHLSVMAIAEENSLAAPFAGKGYWNDPDMLITGDHGLSQDEQKAHFALWCLMSAPLMLGNDPRNMMQAEKEIVLNRECIAVNQDPTEQGRRVRVDGKTEIWVKKLADNRAAVLMLNRDGKSARNVTLRSSDLGFSGKWKARDVFGKQDLGTFEASLSKLARPHAGWFVLVSEL
jgi:alpha-galactosidase